uniref:(northern house mosquito) hypothetical protein n=1 Tax=Culex pipiens TaxID=7175 RepID=A0A8D8MPM1_CULPI
MHVVQRSQPLLARCCQPKTKHFSHHNTPHHTTEIDPLFRRTCSPGLHADFCPRCSLSVDVHNLTVVFFVPSTKDLQDRDGRISRFRRRMDVLYDSFNRIGKFKAEFCGNC